MRKFIISIIFFSVCHVSIGQNVPLKEEKAVKKLIQDAFDDIWSAKDAAKITQYHTEDFLLLEHGEVWNNDTIRSYTEKALKAKRIPKRENKFDFIKIEKLGQSIWVAYHNYATLTLDGKIIRELQWLESAIAVKTKKGWKLKMLHSTRVETK
ncbi:MAG: nuclear transport factor 2 family protein [Bacteroidota bacterium]